MRVLLAEDDEAPAETGTEPVNLSETRQPGKC
jgi:hypothetical protein